MFSQQEWEQQVEEIIEDRCRHSPYYLLLGMRVKELSHGEARVEIEVRERHLDSGGHVHPGVIISLADAASGVAAATTVLGGSRRVATVEMKVNFISEATGGTLSAVGKVTGRKGRVLFSRAEVRSEDGGLVAESSATYVVNPRRT